MLGWLGLRVCLAVSGGGGVGPNWYRTAVDINMNGVSQVCRWLLCVGVWWCAGLLANRSSDRSCASGMIHNKIHRIRPGCLRPSIALKVQNRGLNNDLFIYIYACTEVFPILVPKLVISTR